MVYWPKGSFGCKRFYCTFRKISIVTRMSRVRYTAGSQAVSVVSLPPSMMPAIIVYCCIVIWKALKGESAKSGFELHLSGVEWEYAERVLTKKGGIVSLLIIYCTLFDVTFVSCRLDGMVFVRLQQIAYRGSREPCQHQNGGNI